MHNVCNGFGIKDSIDFRKTSKCATSFIDFGIKDFIDSRKFNKCVTFSNELGIKDAIDLRKSNTCQAFYAIFAQTLSPDFAGSA